MISNKQIRTLPRMKSVIVILSGFVLPAPASASCGASFCLVNTDWAIQGAWLDHGVHLDLRFEQVRQDQLMHGSDKINANQIDIGNREVETRSHRWLANLDYGLNEHWGLTASLPFLDRSHEHTENGKPVTWNFRQIGDARIMARYQTALFEDAQGGAAVSGFNFGLKLPTGKKRLPTIQAPRQKEVCNLEQVVRICWQESTTGKFSQTCVVVGLFRQISSHH